jgi:hypothetical protein
VTAWRRHYRRDGFGAVPAAPAPRRRLHLSLLALVATDWASSRRAQRTIETYVHVEEADWTT